MNATDHTPNAMESRRSTMGYQPALDGLRALSVALVILYHAGVVTHAALPAGSPAPWFFDGGFLGVEVFFVVSGYLITTLLLEERERTGRVSLRGFWVRRFRRLMPALWTTVAATALWAAIWGRDFVSGLRRDALFGLTYLANFQQLFDKVSYFDGPPSLVRHLWSLAVEEHFYLLFPPILMWMLVRRQWSNRRLLFGVVGCAVVSMVSVVVVWARPVERLGETGVVLDDLRQNWAYLSSFTRMGGILVGVALAVVWSPWRRRVAGRGLDVVGVLAVLGVVLVSLWWSSDSPVLYRGGLAGVSLLSAVAIAAAVHPGSRVMRVVFGNRVMAGLGRRSYGLYLWHWPVFVGPLGGRATWVRLVVGVPVTLVLSELCLRLVETPIRRGVLGRWARRVGTALPVAALAVAMAAVVAVLFVAESRATESESAGGEVYSDALDQEAGVETPVPDSGSPTDLTDTTVGASEVPATGPSGDSAVTQVGPTTTAPRLPRRVLVVGDSTAGAFVKNVPRKSAEQFRFFDGSLSGCSIHSSGQPFSAVRFGRDFAACEGWEQTWSAAAKASAAEVVLVIVGAWDVFSMRRDTGTLWFGTPAWDAYWISQMRLGIEQLKRHGAQVALLQIPCYRPHFTGGPGTYELPERGTDGRTQHVDALLRLVADTDPDVTHLWGPRAWCGDESISTDLRYRYDGVHPTGRGAGLIYSTIAAELLRIPVDADQHAKRVRWR